MSATNRFELDMIANHASLAVVDPLRLAGACPVPSAAQVAAVYRRTADVYAARIKLMPAVW